MSAKATSWVMAAALLLAGCAGAPVSTDATQTTASASPSSAATASPGPKATPLPLLGPMPTSTLDAATASRLEGVLEAIVASGKPDVIAAVITPQGTWSGAAGIDGPGGRKAAPADVAAIASVGKMLEAALVERLAEQGKLDLDAPLATYLGGLDVDANGATIRQALAMRSGIGDTPGEINDQVSADCGHAWTRAEVLAAIPAPHASPGAQFKYSNPTYKLLGYAIESVTGQPLATALEEGILAPAGVGERILLPGFGWQAPRPWALPIAGHTGGMALDQFGRGGALPCLSHAMFSLNTGMSGDMPSLARWGWAFFAGQLVGPATVAEMLPAADEDTFGLGVEQWMDFGVPTYGHAGNKPGYKTALIYQPYKGAVLALVINDAEADVISASRRILDVLSVPK